jgi:hypothetical protein
VPDGPATLTTTAARSLSLATVVGVAVLTLAARLTSSPLARSLLLSGAAGAAFGVASVLTKSALGGITDGGLGATSLPALATIASLATAGLLLGQLSYQGAGLAAPLAMVSVANPVVATIIGILLLGEGFRFGATGAILALIAATVAARGVVGLASRAPACNRHETSTPGGRITPADADTHLVVRIATSSNLPHLEQMTAKPRGLPADRRIRPPVVRHERCSSARRWQTYIAWSSPRPSEADGTGCHRTEVAVQAAATSGGSTQAIRKIRTECLT